MAAMLGVSGAVVLAGIFSIGFTGMSTVAALDTLYQFGNLGL